MRFVLAAGLSAGALDGHKFAHKLGRRVAPSEKIHRAASRTIYIRASPTLPRT
eukprot:COSAG02_NODE_39927_length_411_cov_0.685897_1_plen_53_part_00